MNLSMTVWMQQYAITCRVTTTFCSPHDVVIVPPRELGDLLAADRTYPVLLFPQVEQLPSPAQVVDHLHAKAFFKVQLPSWVIRIGFTFDLDVTCDCHARRIKQTYSIGFPIPAVCLSAEHPVLPFDAVKVFILHPPPGLLLMSASCPLP